MPQEIEVWYIIPALRREVAKSLIEIGLSQKQTAEKMDITEAAVSQYLSSKRAKDVIFSNAILEEVRKSAKIIFEDNSRLVPEMLRLSNLTGVKQVMCDLHKKNDISLPGSCNICFEGDTINISKGENI
jgi:uncharacterized protein